MSQITSDTKAFEILSKGLTTHVGLDKWDKLISQIEIYCKMTTGEKIIIYESKKIMGYRELPTELLLEESKACLFLRDNLIALTGDRIWGLTFILYPDGKFEIEYDYNKPEDYEETDEVITGEEINQTFLK